ncbi:BnaC02g25500D [Brassica napus]|uniref:BnaC02g25500D protein n=1 Tax=Brassica napus TaxID=3708 RepID=A0A078FLF3_BRANA|nr:BnaC06g07610D [Brassica napus]CDY22246.1 BnaC02g25500D [Brassica napus]
MNILRGSSSGPAKRSRQTCLPPGLNRPATPASSASRHPLPSLAAVMRGPGGRKMPLLHPQRPNGTLWFGIYDCIRKDVVSTYQSNFWGPWWTYRMVPDEKKVAWWTSFLQQYYWDPKHHSQVRFQWEQILKSSIRDLEEPHQKRSKTNSENASSNPDDC